MVYESHKPWLKCLWSDERFHEIMYFENILNRDR